MKAKATITVDRDTNTSKGSKLKIQRTINIRMTLKMTLKMASNPRSIFVLAAIVAPIRTEWKELNCECDTFATEVLL
jgi:hypothetical protein